MHKMYTTTANHQQPANQQLRGGLGVACKPARRLLALDTETTGADCWHGCKPFFISIASADGDLYWWEWDVDPYTREVQVQPGDLLEIQKLLYNNDFVFHNAKFDLHALSTIGLQLPPWEHIHDTLLAAHALVNNESHKLKELALRYLDIPDDDQKHLQHATNEARRFARQLGWSIADKPHPHFPAARSAPKDGWWCYDTWLPRTITKHWHKHFPSHPPADWGTVLRQYALRDAERTICLWLMQKHALEEEGLWNIYETRRQALQVAYQMECNGVTLHYGRISELRSNLKKLAREAEAKCLKLANAQVAKLIKTTKPTSPKPTSPKPTSPKPASPKPASPKPAGPITNLNSHKQLQSVLYQQFGLRPVKTTKTGYATDKEVLLHYYERTHDQPAVHEFIHNLFVYRKCSKAEDYLEEYQQRAIPVRTAAKPPHGPVGSPAQYCILHGNYNLAGTDTTRLSCSNPNLQNIGKQVDQQFGDFNLRKVFGPMPGRVWYSLDYNNIELRIFAYESEDKKLIAAFEQGFQVHCVFAELLWPKEWKACYKEVLTTMNHKEREGPLSLQQAATAWGDTAELFKSRYKSTLYQWTKNGNFSLIYGASADRANTTYHHPEAYQLIRSRMPRIDDFLNLKNHEAQSTGCIRTLPRAPGSNKCIGYRLYVPPDESHVAVNYFIQGTAGWCMILAMNRVYKYLSTLNKKYRLDGPSGYKVIMSNHDELNFDFPASEHSDEIICHVARLMEQSGDDIGIPTPVNIERHTNNWAEGEKVLPPEKREVAPPGLCVKEVV